MRGAVKDSANPFFKSKYADLASIWDACREPLSKNELAIIQIPQCDGIETILAHSSGEWIKGFLKISPAKQDAQSIGSALTYARRYALAAMVGIAPEDDDGNAAVTPPAPKEKEKPLPPQATPRSTKANGDNDKVTKAIAYMESKGFTLEIMEKWIGYPRDLWKDEDMAVLRQKAREYPKGMPLESPTQPNQPPTQANGSTQPENGSTEAASLFTAILEGFKATKTPEEFDNCLSTYQSAKESMSPGEVSAINSAMSVAEERLGM
jgi:hypothetical protein